MAILFNTVFYSIWRHQLKLHVDPDGEQQEDDSEKRYFSICYRNSADVKSGQAQFEGRVHKRTVNLTIYSQKKRFLMKCALELAEFSDTLSAQASLATFPIDKLQV